MELSLNQIKALSDAQLYLALAGADGWQQVFIQKGADNDLQQVEYVIGVPPGMPITDDAFRAVGDYGSLDTLHALERKVMGDEQGNWCIFWDALEDTTDCVDYNGGWGGSHIDREKFLNATARQRGEAIYIVYLQLNDEGPTEDDANQAL